MFQLWQELQSNEAVLLISRIEVSVIYWDQGVGVNLVAEGVGF